MEKKKNQFLYLKVYNDIRSKIEDGSYRPQSRLPVDEELKNTYGVSLITIKKALSMLKEEGFIRRVPGMGSFVLDPAEGEKEKADYADGVPSGRISGTTSSREVFQHIDVEMPYRDMDVTLTDSKMSGRRITENRSSAGAESNTGVEGGAWAGSNTGVEGGAWAGSNAGVKGGAWARSNAGVEGGAWAGSNIGVECGAGEGSFTEERFGLPKNSAQIPKLGLILEHVSSSFGLDMVYRLDQEAEERGYKLLIRFSYYNREKENREIDFLLDEGVEGLVVMPCHGQYYNPKLLKLILEGFPVVLIDKSMEGISVPTVRTDNEAAVRTLVHELHRQGSRNIGFLTYKLEGTSSLMDRKQGFEDAARELDMQDPPECEVEFDQSIFENTPPRKNVDRIVEYLRKYPGLDGLVCAEYNMIPALEAASREVGHEPGKSLKVGCVDGPIHSGYTHMHQDETVMARKAMELFLRIKNAPGHQREQVSEEDTVLVPAKLICGDSGRYGG